MTARRRWGLDHLALEYDDTADLGIFIYLNDSIGPIGVECLEVLSAAFDDQLFEHGFIGVFKFTTTYLPLSTTIAGSTKMRSPL